MTADDRGSPAEHTGSEPTRSERNQREAAEFDAQTSERLAHGFVPDWRRLAPVDWFYNNVWRDPEMARLHWGPRLEWIIGQAVQAGGPVLELGCGSGMLSLEMARHGLAVTGVDLSPASIRAACRYRDENPFTEGFGRLDYLCDDFFALDLPAEGFATVVFFRSLHHFPDMGAVMARVNTLLRPGGDLIICEPVRAHFNQDSARMAAILRLVLPTWEPRADKLAGEWTDRRFAESFTKIFEEYTYAGEHHQSEWDNSTDNAEDIKAAVREHMTIVSESYSDAFTDKLLGGLRGDDRHDLARFLIALDAHLVSNNILPPSSLELQARK